MQKSTFCKSALILILTASLLVGCAKAKNPGAGTEGTDGPAAFPAFSEESGPSDSSGAHPGESGATAAQTPVITPEAKTEADESGGKSFSVGALSMRYTKYDLDDSEDADGMTAVTFAGENAQIDGPGADFSDGLLRITAGGVYRLSGTLTEGRVVITAPEDAKVRLVLAGLDITCSHDAAIYAQSADKVILTLASGSVNRVTDSDFTVRAEGDTRSPAAIYGAVSLSVNGAGSLTVNAAYHHAIATKKTLRVSGGTLNLTAAGAGLKGNNAVGVCGGEITLNVGGDGIKTEEIEDVTQGCVFLSGGTVTVTAGSDGINGALYTLITGGQIDITTTGTEVSTDTDGTQGSGDPGNPGDPGAMDPGAAPGGRPGGGRPGGGHGTGGWGGGGGGGGGFGGQSVQAPASKGIKAGSQLLILGGRITVNSTGHCVHSSGALTVSEDADLTLTSSMGKGIQGHGDVTLSGGRIRIVKSTEGIESKANICITGGDTEIYATDDGINLGSSTGVLRISGGSVCVCVASGDTDGIDSNNTIEITGGVVTVKAAAATGNMAAIDAQRSVTVRGGTLVLLCGGSGLSGSVSTGLRTVRLTGSLPVGDYTVVDGNGVEVFTFRVPAATNGGWIGSSLLESGCSYVLLGPVGSALKSWTQSGSM